MRPATTVWYHSLARSLFLNWYHCLPLPAPAPPAVVKQALNFFGLFLLCSSSGSELMEETSSDERRVSSFGVDLSKVLALEPPAPLSKDVPEPTFVSCW